MDRGAFVAHPTSQGELPKMPTLLHLDSSAMGDTSVSRHLTATFVKDWTAKHPDGTVVTRDVAKSGLTPVTAAWIGAAHTPAEAQTAEQKGLMALSEELLAELFGADEWVIGVAMYNFSIPSTLKMWIDQIARAGKTFAYGANGPKGLITGKKVTILLATGGDYTPGAPAAAYNFAEPYLRAILGFLGVTDLTVVTASGTAALMNPATDRAAFLAPFDAKVAELVS
jgi:FMN-dependent NADH-azoreductase